MKLVTATICTSSVGEDGDQQPTAFMTQPKPDAEARDCRRLNEGLVLKSASREFKPRCLIQ